MVITGEFQDTIIKPSGKKIVYPWQKNQIQNSFSVGLAGLCKEYNFGNGVGTGINYIAYGTGNADWWNNSATFGTVTSNKAEPYLFPDAGKLTVKFDGDDLKIRTVDAATMADNPSGWSNLTQDILDGITAFFSGDGVAYRTDSGYLAIRTITPGSTGSVQIIAQTTEVDLAGSNYFDLPISTDTGLDAGVANPTRDYDAVQIYNEFARQEITAQEITWVNCTDYSASVSPTNCLEFNISRGATVEDEVHGEYGLYISANTNQGSGKMVNWSVRQTRVTKYAGDTLQTIYRLKFLQGGG